MTPRLAPALLLLAVLAVLACTSTEAEYLGSQDAFVTATRQRIHAAVAAATHAQPGTCSLPDGTRARLDGGSGNTDFVNLCDFRRCDLGRLAFDPAVTRFLEATETWAAHRETYQPQGSSSELKALFKRVRRVRYLVVFEERRFFSPYRYTGAVRVSLVDFATATVLCSAEGVRHDRTRPGYGAAFKRSAEALVTAELKLEPSPEFWNGLGHAFPAGREYGPNVQGSE